MMTRIPRLEIAVLALGALLLAAGCAQKEAETATATPGVDVAAESARLYTFVDDAFMEMVMRSPIFQDYMSVKKDQDKWPDPSDAFDEETLQIRKRQLAGLRAQFDPANLDPAAALSYRLFEEQIEEQIEDHKFRWHGYPVNQMGGFQSRTAAHLINMHRVAEVADAENYIARLERLDDYFGGLIDNLKIRAEKGIVAPKFVYPYVVADSRRIISGAPFDDSGEDSTLLADFRKKVAKLEIAQADKDALVARAEKALLTSVKPAYEKLITVVQEVESRATTDDGAWKLPDGAAYYKMRLARTTTTDMTADEIHELGLAEVARIHSEMRTIMDVVGFEGTLQEFFEFMREDEQFYYPETEEGKAQYLAKATALIDRMRGDLDRMFITKPKADLVVKAVEPFRAQSAGKAFYQRPAPDGTRPGTYYANLYSMSAMPNYQMEALAYHEGIPGHHMQIAISMELENVPMFRKFGGYTVYSEGWGLYTELLPKEFGYYEDPYSDFGRLAMELWRACRLVVDTGLHDRRWSREKAIEYLGSNTPNPHSDVVKAIERYIVMPGQATAYKIGMNKLLEMRGAAQAKLGDDFDIRQFHDVILRDGPLPLSVLEDHVDAWVAETLAAREG